MAAESWPEAWRHAIRGLGGDVELRPPHVAMPEKAMGAVTLDGVDVRIDGTVVMPTPGSLGLSMYDIVTPGGGGTLLWVAAPGSGSLSLKVKHGHVYPIGRALGIQDERTGDEPFDDRFVVKTNSRSMALTWLDTPLRAAMLRAPDYAYVLEKGSAAAVLPSIETDGATLAAAIRAMALLGGRLARAIASWRELAADLGVRYTGGEMPRPHESRHANPSPFHTLELEAEHEGARVVFDVCFESASQRKRAHKALYTRARCRRAAGNETEFRWTLNDPPAGLNEDLRERLLVAGIDAAFTEGEHVTLLYPGLLGDAVVARNLIVLAAALADAEPQSLKRGPYR